MLTSIVNRITLMLTFSRETIGPKERAHFVLSSVKHSLRLLCIIIIIIIVIFKCYFSREHIALSYIKWREHEIRKEQQIKSTAHDGKSYLK